MRKMKELERGAVSRQHLDEKTVNCALWVKNVFKRFHPSW